MKRNTPVPYRKAIGFLLFCMLFSLLSAESITIEGDGCSLLGENGIVYLQDADGVKRIELDGLDLRWETPRTAGGTLVKTSPHQLSIDYQIADDPGGEVAVSAVFILTGKTLTATYTLSAPPTLDIGGSMLLREALNATASSYFSVTKQRRHDYASPLFVFEMFQGNPSWHDPWQQHVGWISEGGDTYTTTVTYTLAPQQIEGDSIRMRGQSGVVYLQDDQGNDLLELSGVELRWEPPIAQGGTVERISPNQLGIQYTITNDASGAVSLYATFTCSGRTVTVDLLLTAPDGTNLGGAVLYRHALNASSHSLEKIGRWVRDVNGGVPYEVRSAYLRQYHYALPILIFEHIGGNKNWQNDWHQHITFHDNQNGTYSASTAFTIHDEEQSAHAIAEYSNSQSAAIRFREPLRAFNLWDEGETPEVVLELTNVQEMPLSGTLHVIARDFDGTVRLDSQESIALASWERYEKTYAVPLLHTPDIAFVESRFVSEGVELCFTRTSVGVLHGYDYTHREMSNIGISAYFDIPTQDDVYRLMDRMGIRWDRHGDSAQSLAEFGALSNYHNNVDPQQWSDDPVSKTAFFQHMLADCDQRGNPYWEFGNEWNMDDIHSGLHADVYVSDWLMPLAAERSGHDVEIMSMGIAGADVTFLNAIAANGGWDLIDAVSMHPGRGNNTPDTTGTGWKYLGAIRAFKEAMAPLGEKPLWLTEVYACTHPNSGWRDSYRRAAENIVLTYALGVSEGMAGVQFYQLHDSVWHDIGGVDPEDSEYHYGILMRDGTLKPSLLAFCAIAEALDGAVFTKYLTFGQSDIKGIEYATPRGNMAVLWSRADGYEYNDSVELEPWESHWSTQTDVVVSSDQSELVVVDMIGRQTTVPVVDGVATLTLTGTPLIVYGINAGALLETGELHWSADSGWQSVLFRSTFENPVVVLSPVSATDNESCHARVSDVTGTGFSYTLEAWDYLGGSHSADETLNYLVVEAGSHDLGGLRWEAGTTSLNGNWKTVSLENTFNGKQACLPQLVTANDAASSNVRVRNVVATSFEMKVQEEEAADGIHSDETVHYIMIEEGSGAVDGVRFAAGATNDTQTDQPATISFGGKFNKPAFFANIQTTHDADSVALRVLGSEITGAVIRIEEEMSSDAETSHPAESIGWLVMEAIWQESANALDSEHEWRMPLFLDYALWSNVNFTDQTSPTERQADDDPDKDGVPNLLEHALGGDPEHFDMSILPKVEVVSDSGKNYLQISYERPNINNGLLYATETTSDFRDVWSRQPEDVFLLSTEAQASGFIRYTYRCADPLHPGDRAFLRISVTQ